MIENAHHAVIIIHSKQFQLIVKERKSAIICYATPKELIVFVYPGVCSDRKVISLDIEIVMEAVGQRKIVRVGILLLLHF